MIKGNAISERDAGLAVERTALAWRRTAAASCTAAALLAHHAFVVHHPLVVGTGFAATVLLLVVTVLGWRRNRLLRRGSRSPAAGYIPATAAVTSCVSSQMLLTVLALSG